MRISFVESIGRHGGMEFYDYGICTAISLQGFDITLFTYEKTLDFKLNKEFDIKYVYRNIYGKRNKILRAARYLYGSFMVFYISKQIKSNIIHFNIYGMSWFSIFEIFISKILGFKVVLTIHDIISLDGSSQNLFTRLLSKLYFSLVNSFLVHSDFAKEELVRHFPIFKTKVFKVPHVDIDFFYKYIGTKTNARERISLNIDKDAKLLLFFGQIKSTKGLDLLIEALSMLVTTHKVYLLIAGRAWRMELDKYESMINELGLNERVYFHTHYIPNEDVCTYFAASDLVVLPYKLVYNSGVLLRSMSYGTPVLCSDLDSFKEVVQDNINGVLFKSNDSKDLANRISFALSSSDLLQKIAVSAGEFISSSHSVEALGSSIKSVYFNFKKCQLGSYE